MPNNILSRLKQSYNNQIAHNHAVDLNLEELNKLLPQVEDHHQLLFRLKYWQGEQNLQYQNLIFFSYFCLALLSLIPVFTIHFTFFILTLLLLGLGIPHIKFSNPNSELIHAMQDFYLQNKYNLRKHQVDQTNPVFPIESFPLFELGDQQNTVRNKMYGQWCIEDQTFPFMIFNYHYLKTTTKLNDKGTLERKAYSFDLFGIMIKNFPARGVSISTNQKKNCRLGIKWSSGDIHFDQRYQLSGFSEIWLAKFFKPSNLLHLETALKAYQGDFYIDPQTSTLCWLFEENIFHCENKQLYPSTVTEFAEQLELIQMPNFEKLSNTIQKLITELQ